MLKEGPLDVQVIEELDIAKEIAALESDLARANGLMTVLQRRLGELDSGLRAEVRAERQTAIANELRAGEDGLDRLRLKIAARVEVVHGERLRLARPLPALVVSAWRAPEKIGPGVALLVDACRLLPVEEVLSSIRQMKEHAGALLGLWTVLRERELSPADAKRLQQAILSAAHAHHLPRRRLQELADVEIQGLRFAVRWLDYFGGSPASKLALGRRIQAAEQQPVPVVEAADVDGSFAVSPENLADPI